MTIRAPEIKRSAVRAGLPVAIADWEFDVISGNVTDSIGSKVMTAGGTLNYEDGPLCRGDEGGDSVDFAGGDFDTPDHVDFAFGTAFSAEVTFNADIVSGTYALAGQQGTGGNAWLIYINGNDLNIDITTGAGTVTVLLASISLGVTYTALVTYDGTTIRLYVDGLLANTGAQTGAISTSTAPISIGAYNAGGSFPFNGSIARLILWDVVLTPQEAARSARVNVARLSDHYDQTVALYDAKYGLPVLGLTMDDPTVTVDDIGSVSVAFAATDIDEYNAVLTRGQLGARFDGVGGSVTLGDVEGFLTGDWYLRTWVKGDVAAGNFPTIFECRELSSDTGFSVWFDKPSTSGGLRVAVGNGATSTTFTTGAGYTNDGAWHLVEVWSDTSLGRVYGRVDGDVEASIAKVFAAQPSGVGVVIGRNIIGTYYKSSQANTELRERLPEVGEGEAVYTAGRSLVENLGDAANNPDYTLTSSYWAAHKAVPTADNYMIWLAPDVDLTTATQLDLSPIASISTGTWESAVRYPAYVAGEGGGIVVTGGNDALTHTVRSEVPFFRTVGIPWSFAASGGFANAGIVVRLDGASTIIDGCPVVFNGDLGAGQNTTDFFYAPGSDGLLRNCLVEFTGDYDQTVDPDVSSGVALEHCTVVSFGTTDLQIGASSITNSAVFGLNGGALNSVWQNVTEVTGQVLADTFGDAAGGDYSVKSTSGAYQSGTLIDGVLTDSEGTTWSAANPNATHLDTLFVAPSDGQGLASGSSSIQSSSGCSFKPTHEHLFV